jgi:hypothetical protein
MVDLNKNISLLNNSFKTFIILNERNMIKYQVYSVMFESVVCILAGMKLVLLMLRVLLDWIEMKEMFEQFD